MVEEQLQKLCPFWNSSYQLPNPLVFKNVILDSLSETNLFKNFNNSIIVIDIDFQCQMSNIEFQKLWVLARKDLRLLEALCVRIVTRSVENKDFF